MGMGQPSSQRQRFIAHLESLVRVAKLPQSPGRVRQANYPGIKPTIAEGERTMAPTIIERDRHFEMLPGEKRLPHPERGGCEPAFLTELKHRPLRSAKRSCWLKETLGQVVRGGADRL